MQLDFVAAADAGYLTLFPILAVEILKTVREIAAVESSGKEIY
jgi:hypothetical protein